MRQQIFKDIFVKTKTLSIKDIDEGLEKFIEKCFESDSESDSESEMPLKNLPSVQGISQVEIARENSVPYFRKVDEIIRCMLLSLK